MQVRRTHCDGGAEIHKWMFLQRSFRRIANLGDNGQTGVDDKIAEEIFSRTGANIIGMKLFEEGEANWSEDPPFHSPVFVLTHKPRSSWQQKGGTTFHFVNDGVESALQNVK
jgi:dihydrofolate reductase